MVCRLSTASDLRLSSLYRFAAPHQLVDSRAFHYCRQVRRRSFLEQRVMRTDLAFLAPGFLLMVTTIATVSKAAIVLSSTSLETCLRSGSNDTSWDGDEPQENCANRAIALVAIDGDTLGSTSEMQFDLSCVGSSDGSCPCKCNYAEDPDCSCRDLSSAISIRVSRTPVLAEYPLTYFASYNSKVYEVGYCNAMSNNDDIVLP